MKIRMRCQTTKPMKDDLYKSFLFFANFFFFECFFFYHTKTNKLKDRVLKAEVHKRIACNIVNHLKCYCESDEQLTLYGDISIQKAVYLFLHHILYYQSYKNMEERFNVPHSNMKQIFGTISNRLVLWSNGIIIPGTRKDRLDEAKAIIKDDEFKSCTLLIDGSDFPLQKQDNLRSKSEWHSYKLKRHGLRYQVIISNSGKVRYVSRSFHPKLHDAHCVIDQKKELKELFNAGEKILADNHYSSLNRQYRRYTWVVPNRKTRSRQLSEEEEKYNKVQRRNRNKIELLFGKVKNRFHFIKMQIPFRGSISSHERYVTISFALHCYIQKC